MDGKYSDLRHKTFLDFAPMDEALDEIICGHSEEDKEFFLSNLEENSRMMTFMAFTDFTDDKELVRAIEDCFREEYNSIFNE